MAIDALLRSGRIRRESVSRTEVREALKLAERDLRVARKLMGEELDWGFTVAYNAVLQAGRAFMFAKGYRPASVGSVECRVGGAGQLSNAGMGMAQRRSPSETVAAPV